MSMDIHIGKGCSKAFCSLYNIRQIREYLSEDTTKILVHAFVTSHVDKFHHCFMVFHSLNMIGYKEFSMPRHV